MPARTPLNVTVAHGPMFPTRLPFELAESDWIETPVSRVAFSAWKIWPRHTFMGCVQVVPLPTHDSAPSLADSPELSACIAQWPEALHCPPEVG